MDFQTVIIESNNSNLGLERIRNVLTHLDPAINSSHPDLFLIASDFQVIGIAKIKALINWSTKKPVTSSMKIGLVRGAENLSIQSQNSLLKLLEEPPVNTQLILIVKNINSLLPTIRSRSQSHRLTDYPKESSSGDSVSEQFRIGNFSERTKMVEDLSSKSRIEVEQFLQELLSGVIRSSSDHRRIIGTANKIKLCINSIQSGGNLRLTLQTLAISIEDSLHF